MAALCRKVVLLLQPVKVAASGRRVVLAVFGTNLNANAMKKHVTKGKI
jgi:hypothetical protein